MLEKVRQTIEYLRSSPEINEGISLLKMEIQDMEEFAKTMETLGKVLGLIGKVVAVAAAPSAISATSLLKAKSASDPKMFESSAEEKTAIAPLEEVLYRVELTPTKLIVTVDAELNRPVEVIFRKG